MACCQSDLLHAGDKIIEPRSQECWSAVEGQQLQPRERAAANKQTGAQACMLRISADDKRYAEGRGHIPAMLKQDFFRKNNVMEEIVMSQGNS